MQKKKKRYIAGIILATVILAVDIIVFAMSKPTATMGTNSGRAFSESGEMPQMPSDSESGEIPQVPSDSESGEMPQVPSDSESGEMPQVPSDSESGEMPQMPSDFESGEMPEGLQIRNTATGFSMVQKVCIPIAVLCVLADIFCGIGLFKLSRQKKLLETEDGAIFAVEDKEAAGKKETAEPVDPVEARLKKKKRNRNRLIALVAILLVGVLILQLWGSGLQQGSSTTVKEEVITAQAENGEISRTLKSSGILASAKDVAVSVPGDITVTKYLVDNGDSVAEGDPIAIVEKNSVMAAIADVQEMINELDDEMEEAKEESISSSIKASVDGTVVAVYAKSGESVVDIMYDKEALLLISLDGLLAVKIDNPGNLTVGESVKVKDSDGNSYTGQVASIEKESVAITVSLDNFSYKEKVTVSDSEGEKLGSGKLYIYSQQKITGYSGTIGSVKVSKGESVSEGDTVLTITDTDYTAAYQRLLSKRTVLENQYNRLVEIGNSGYVYAEEAGTISGVDESLLVAGADDSSDIADSGEQNSESSQSTEAAAAKTAYKASVGKFTTLSAKSSESSATTATDSDTATTESSTETSTETTIPEETVSKSVNVVWMDSAGNVMTEGMPESMTVQLWSGTELAGEQTLNAENQWKYTWSGLAKYNADGTEINYTVKEKEAVEGYTTATQMADSITMLIHTKQSSNQEQNNSADQGNTDAAGNENSSGNTNQMPGEGTAQNGSNGSGLTDGTANHTAMGSTDSGTFGGSSGTAASAGVAATTTETEEEDATYVFAETDICMLSPNDVVEVDITIDELDINSVKTGQECMITLDAFQGQSFTGEVIYLDQSGTNSGGNTKYTVTVSMEKEENMLLGMNASVQIALSTEKDILAIPEEALVEQDGNVYVYTEYNKKSDELAGLVEVTTGVSDGQNVQILEGLEAGQEYYYRYADTISYSFVK